MADTTKPFSKVVLEHGRDTAYAAAEALAAWRAWADALDELARTIPAYYQPEVYGEDGDREPVELAHVDRSSVRDNLYQVLAVADAYTVGLGRAADYVIVRSEELSEAFAIDESDEDGDRRA